MTEDPFVRLVEEQRARTMEELRQLLRDVPDPVLQKLAVDLVPALFRNDYRGERAASGARWAHAFARPRSNALPTFLVRIHSGPFSADDADNLRMTMQGANITQAAVAVIGEGALTASVRTLLGSSVPWLLDTDGLVNLMMNANVGTALRVYEAKYVNPEYFR
ncbi:MAG TPA: hypothetical protein VEK11_12925 [Thermoanaerobaculia bacterium]|jgi:hypothetical protein|nr:hypothetical protein [Thermoanaerobaculia bacterium]